MTEQTSRIIAANPKLVRDSFPADQLNLTPRVHRVSKEVDIKVLTCTRTDYDNRDLNAVRAEIDVLMAPYVDGFFADKVTNIVTDLEYDYYVSLHQRAKSHGQDKLSIVNPGHYK